MRICLYTHTALPLIGGQEIVVDRLARCFVAQGHEPMVLAPRPSRRWLLGDDQLPYPVYRHPRFISMRKIVSWYRWWLLRLHRRHRFDVVHVHGVYPAGYVAALSRVPFAWPYVLTSHGEDLAGTSHLLSDPELRKRHVLALDRADALIAISQFTAQGMRDLCSLADGKIRHLSNGVDFDLLANPAPRPPQLPPAIRPGEYVLFLGRLHPRKWADGLLAALALVPDSGRLELVVAGDGPARHELESQAAAARLQNRVIFVGMAGGAVKTFLLQNARALVVPSRGWEGQPLVVLESYAAGRPVIVSDLPGFADMVHEGETGWTFPSGSIDALAQRLRRALDPATPLDAMGLRGRALARNLGWPAIAARHVALYEELRTGKTQRKSA